MFRCCCFWKRYVACSIQLGLRGCVTGPHNIVARANAILKKYIARLREYFEKCSDANSLEDVISHFQRNCALEVALLVPKIVLRSSL